MFISRLFATFCLLALFELPQTDTAPLGIQESFGLQSVQDFCRNEGRLDDLKDLAADVYRKETGRFYVVSIIICNLASGPGLSCFTGNSTRMEHS